MKKLGRNDLCWCGSGKKYKHCHEAFDEKLMEAADAGHQIPDHDMIKTPEQIEGIRESCKINVAVLDYVAEHIKAGVTTEEIDQWVYNETTRMGGIPAPLGYEGFPKSVCTSINDQVCHGIPSADVVLKDGDIINVDVSTIYHGYYADSSRMFCIGNVSPEHKKLVDVVKECVELGLEQVKPWGFMGDMAEAVQKHAEERHRHDVCTGHDVHDRADDQRGNRGGIRGWRRRLECIHEGWKSIRPVGDPGAGN